MVELDKVVDASLFSSDLVGLEDACNKRKFKQQNKNGETCSFCEHCGDKFKNRKDIRKHVAASHEGITCFFCEHCGTKFNVHHNLCDFCEYSTIRKETLKVHEDAVHNKTRLNYLKVTTKLIVFKLN